MCAIENSPSMRLTGFDCIPLTQSVWMRFDASRHTIIAGPSSRPVFFLPPFILICMSAMGSAMCHAPQCSRSYGAPRRTVAPVTHLVLVRYMVPSARARSRPVAVIHRAETHRGPLLQSTQFLEATDSVFRRPFNHMILLHSKRYRRFKAQDIRIKMCLMVW